MVIPYSRTERIIADIWKRLLRRPEIDPNYDFFDLGGNSLLAIDLIKELNRSFGVDLPVVTLLESATVAALADKVEYLISVDASNREGVSHCIVPINSDGTLPPLFCIGAVGGNALGIQRLAGALGSEQPVYCLELDNSREQRSIEQIAREIVAQVRRSQPRGPYYLSGFSAGGVIALEAARLLRERNERVPLLVLLDAFNPNLPRWSAPERAWLFGKMIGSAGPAYAWKRLVARYRLKFELTRMKVLGTTTSNSRGDHLSLNAQFTLALKSYRPAPYDGDALLVRANHRGPDVDFRNNEANGWRETISGRFNVATLECRHEQVLGERTLDTANLVRRGLELAREKDVRRHTDAAADGVR